MRSSGRVVPVSAIAAAASEAPVVRTSCGEFVATGLTVSEIGVECVADAPVPVTVTVTVPVGVEADVVISCVNVDGVEPSAILLTKPRGKIYFFAMSTSFTAPFRARCSATRRPMPPRPPVTT